MFQLRGGCPVQQMYSSLMCDLARGEDRSTLGHQRLGFAAKLTAEPWLVDEPDRAALRQVGFTERDIWDIAAVAGFFNMSNRVASATDMRPNSVYHGQAR